MKYYTAIRWPNGETECWVCVQGHPPRKLTIPDWVRINGFKPPMFVWGKVTAGSHWFAIALLYDSCGNDQAAVAFAPALVSALLEKSPGDVFMVSCEALQSFHDALMCGKEPYFDRVIAHE